MAKPSIQESLKKEHANLSREIKKHKKLYYQDDAPEISDAEYDKLEKKLQNIEEKYPDLAKNSILHKTGDDPTKEFTTHSHIVMSGSIANAFDADDIKLFIKKTEQFLRLDNDKLSFVVEPKIDGVSISLTYQNGKLTVGATRGNGYIGENITDNIKVIKGIPTTLAGNNHPALIEVRGEIFISETELKNINESDEDLKFANARNLASGSLRQLNPEITRKRNLLFLVHGTGFISDDLRLENYTAIRKIMQDWGLPLCPMLGEAKDTQGLMDIYNQNYSQKGHFTIDDVICDGLVYKVNNIDLRNRLGIVGNKPRWALAHKFPEQESSTPTELLDIKLQVGRTGTITPVGVLEKILLDGVEIERASLHNGSIIRQKNINIGDMVTVKRAGGVIPQISRVAESRSDVAFQFPDYCPSCGAKLFKSEDLKDIYCPASLDCTDQRLRWLEYVSSKKCLDIDGAGQKSIQQFYDLAFIKYPADLFHLKERQDEILALEGWSHKSLLDLLNNIEGVKGISFEKFIVCLGIPGISSEIAKKIARHFISYDNLREPRNYPEIDIDGMGDKKNQEIYNFFDDAKKLKASDDLYKEIIPKSYTKKAVPLSSMSGTTVLFSGKLNLFSRQEAKEKSKKAGILVASNVSANLDYLVYGVGKSTRQQKAEKIQQYEAEKYLKLKLDPAKDQKTLNKFYTRIISFDNFFDMLKTAPLITENTDPDNNKKTVVFTQCPEGSEEKAKELGMEVANKMPSFSLDYFIYGDEKKAADKIKKVKLIQKYNAEQYLEKEVTPEIANQFFPKAIGEEDILNDTLIGKNCYLFQCQETTKEKLKKLPAQLVNQIPDKVHYLVYGTEPELNKEINEVKAYKKSLAAEGKLAIAPKVIQEREFFKLLEDATKKEKNQNTLLGKNIIFTGKVGSLTREEAKEIAETAGAKVLSGVSSKLDYLVCDDQNTKSSKLQKVKKLQNTGQENYPKIISSKDFLAMANAT